jgi:hypothetical protein
MKTNLRLSSLSYLAHEVNAAIDAGRGLDMAFDEVYDAVDQGRVIEFLTERLGETVDLSLLNPGDEQERALAPVLQDVAASLRGRERRKTGVERNGLCLIMTFCLGAIQARFWE